MSDQPQQFGGKSGEYVDRARDAAGDYAQDNPDKARSMIDKVEDLIDDKTGGRYADAVDRGGDWVEKQLGLPTEEESQPTTPGEPAPGEPAPQTPTEPTPQTPAEPAPAEPTPAEPLPAEPAPSEPAPAEPAPSEPAPSPPGPAEPSPPEPTTPEGGFRPYEPSDDPAREG
ncbi:antitoxin [Serinicoccus kebangsaanensis]|uniref:antitoxin n=1 Tax=Serinicoccus kebangsaanensis TaxID=2602069 RepID=UPI00124F3DEE|nr:antitoxin [Serinicoccus kebangsaanensis]